MTTPEPTPESTPEPTREPAHEPVEEFETPAEVRQEALLLERAIGG